MKDRGNHLIQCQAPGGASNKSKLMMIERRLPAPPSGRALLRASHPSLCLQTDPETPAHTSRPPSLPLLKPQDPGGTLSGRGRSFCLSLYDCDSEDSDKPPLDRGGGGAAEGPHTRKLASEDSHWNNEEVPKRGDCRRGESGQRET